MQAQLQPEVKATALGIEQAHDAAPEARWNAAKRIGFRFAFAYLVLYCLPFPFNYTFPYIGRQIMQAYNEIWYAVVPWVGKHILHISYEMPINRMGGGSGDTTYGYTLVLCFLTLAVAVTGVWSLLDRKRANYIRLNQWLRLYVRLYLAHYMIIYGAMKAIPMQMSFPDLAKLLQPYGNSSPMGVLWDFMGVSAAYTSITGCVELLGGILLILPGTALLGALVSVVAMTQVWLLNMCYDVPVKLFSFHLMLASVFLLAPHLQRLADVVVFNRRVEPTQALPFFRRRWLNWGLLALQVVFGGYMVYTQLSSNYAGYYFYGSGAPKPQHYGIWNVEEFSVDGEMKPPLTTDESRWQRVIIDRRSSIQSMSGAAMPFYLQLDQEKKTVTLRKMEDRNWKAELAFEEPEPGRMTIAGEVDGHKTQAKLVRYDEKKFFLNSRGFSWIQERPVNR